ncbi:MAG: sulfate/molybdate ABC transporter ATP-binding protein [Beijerinckiaceae bacterium]|nr:sulfate/molybdate ABC transporter ATP-binding protein [Beijerinckiaceae bacterium]
MEIRIDRIAKEFGGSKALDGVDLTIGSGELVGLLGPSGSGKTTLLRIIAGLEMPTSGSIFFDSDNASGWTVQERRVGFVFQQYALFRHMSVFENVAYGLRVRPKKTRPHETDIVRRVASLLDLMQLGDYGRRFPAQLSGGQRQRVALARALAVEPRVLLLDEPFGALDAAVRKELRSWLRTLHNKTGHTSVFVTHDQDEALELSDRVAVLNRGRIEQVGTPDAIYDSPRTPFVFGFIGTSSRIAVTIAGGQVSLDGSILPLTPAALPDGPATLYVRPGDFTVADGANGSIHGLVTVQRRIGPVRRIEVAVGAARALVEIDIPAHRTFEIGKPVSISLLRAAVFPEAGGIEPVCVETALMPSVLPLHQPSRWHA